VRFKLGPVPEDEAFDPDADGWIRLREPRSGRLMLMAVPLGMALAALPLWLWTQLLPIQMPAASSGFAFSVDVRQFAGVVLAVVGFVVIHEVLHTLPAFIAGRSRDVVIGFWPRYFTPYAALTGAFPRDGQLLIGATPFLVLTLIPFPLAIMFPQAVWWLAALSVVNALGSGADLIMLFLLARQVPRAAVIRNQGTATYWRAAV
jgi:hypothetical protein